MKFGGKVGPRDFKEELASDWVESLDRCFKFQAAARGFLEQRREKQRGQPLIQAAKELADLAQDFFSDAEIYGRVIINEQFLPLEKKTIPPRNVGGVAGGEKFIIPCRGIMFKFAHDFQGIYGGENWALKAANHELRNLIALYNLSLPDLYFPLMAVIDYFGYRLLAVSILPVLGEKTLKYGSCNQGRTVLTESTSLNVRMAECGRQLNLKPYTYKGKTLHLCTDFEAHEGKAEMLVSYRQSKTLSPVELNPRTQQDKQEHLQTPDAQFNSLASLLRPDKDNALHAATSKADSLEAFYLCDMARVFPPCCVSPYIKLPSRQVSQPGHRPNMTLYRVFRPRFVATYPIPLCAESYSSMQDEDSRRQNTDELMGAVMELQVTRVAQFAQKLEKIDFQSLGSTPFDLTHEMHKDGLNMHLLGLIWLKLTKLECKELVTTEILARVGKNLIREQLRKQCKEKGTVSDVTGQEIVARVFTQLLFDINGKTYDFVHRYSKEIIEAQSFWRTNAMQGNLWLYLKEAFFDDSILFFQDIAIQKTALEEFIKDTNISLNRSKVLRKMLKMLSLELSDASREWRLNRNIYYQPFLPSEIGKLPIQIAFMDIISQAEGIMLYAEALELCGEQCRGVLGMAIPRLRHALNVLQNSATAHQWLGRALYQLAVHELDPKAAQLCLSEAKFHFSEAANIQSKQTYSAHNTGSKELGEESDYAAALHLCETAGKTLGWGKLMTLTGHEDSVEDFVTPLPHQCQDRLVSCSRDGTIRVWDLRQSDGVLMQKVDAHSGPIWCLGQIKYAEDTSLLVSGGNDFILKLWTHSSDFSNFLQVASANLKHLHSAIIRCLYSPQPQYLLSADQNGKLVLSFFNDNHDLGACQTQTIIPEARVWYHGVNQINSITSFQPSPIVFWATGQEIVAFNLHQNIRVGSVQIGMGMRPWGELKRDFANNVCTVDENMLAAGFQSGKVALIDTRTLKTMHYTDEGHSGNIERCCVVSGQGISLVATGSVDCSVCLFDVRSSRVLKKWEHHSDTVWGLRWHEKRQTLVSGSRDKCINLYSQLDNTNY